YGDDKELRVDDDGVSLKDRSGVKEIASSKADDDDGDGESSGRRWAWAWPLTWYLYMVIFLKRMRTTPGGRIMSIHLERADGAPLEKKDRFYRAAFSVVSGYCLGIGFLWA